MDYSKHLKILFNKILLFFFSARNVFLLSLRFSSLFLFFKHLILKIFSSLQEAIVLEKERGSLFFAVPILLGVGIFIYIAMPYEPHGLYLFGLILCFGLLCFLFQTRRFLFYSFFSLLLISLGVFCIKFEVYRINTSLLGSPVFTDLTGHVLEIEQISEKTARLFMDVIETKNPKLYYPPQRVRVKVFSFDPTIIMPGSFVQGRVRLQPIGGPIVPHGHDFSFSSFFDQIGANGFFLKSPQIVKESKKISVTQRALTKINRIRHKIKTKIQAVLSTPASDVAIALIIGAKQSIPIQVKESFRKTGLSHILSISGMHLTLIALTIMFFVRFFFSYFLFFSSLWPIKKYAAAIALVLITFYLLISGAEIPAQRSFIMLSIMLIAVIFDRSALTVRNLALAATISLILAPHEIFEPGFQMSFSATLCLIGAYQIKQDIQKKYPKRKNNIDSFSFWKRMLIKILYVLMAIAFTSLVAGLGSGIYAAWKFQRISMIGVFANLIVMPIVSFLIMPAALLSMIAMPLGWEKIFLLLMGKGIEYMIMISSWLSHHPGIDFIVHLSLLSVIFFTLSILFCMLLSTSIRFVSIPFALLGFFFMGMEKDVDILVAENANLIALKGKDKKIFISRMQTKNFILKNWKPLLGGHDIVKPIMCSAKKNQQDICKKNIEDFSSHAEGRHFFDHNLADQFVCYKDFCIAKHFKGPLVAITKTQKNLPFLCSIASFLIISDASSKHSCKQKHVSVVSAQTLALLGSTSIRFQWNKENILKGFTMHHAIAYPLRPWHRHRKFSRSARGLKPKEKNHFLLNR